jgi:hypothetical protein
MVVDTVGEAVCVRSAVSAGILFGEEIQGIGSWKIKKTATDRCQNMSRFKTLGERHKVKSIAV